MSELTAPVLRELLISLAGDDEDLSSVGDITTTTFDDLGFDSLALMELSARIRREYGVEIDDEQLAELATPGMLLELVDDALGRRTGAGPAPGA